MQNFTIPRRISQHDRNAMLWFKVCDSERDLLTAFLEPEWISSFLFYAFLSDWPTKEKNNNTMDVLKICVSEWVVIDDFEVMTDLI